MRQYFRKSAKEINEGVGWFWNELLSYRYLGKCRLHGSWFPLPLGSGYYRTFKKKIGGPFAVAVRRNFFPY